MQCRIKNSGERYFLFSARIVTKLCRARGESSPRSSLVFCFFFFGGEGILLTDLLVPIMPKFQDLTRDFFRMVVKQWMRSPKITGTIIIRFVLQCVY